MLFLVTGAPGHGKSQYAIDQVLQRSKAENRPVFYANVELDVPGWKVFDPLAVSSDRAAGAYHEYRYEGVPDGALLLIDEASFVFEAKGKRETPPEQKLLTTHRHAGYDIYIVTQHAMDLPVLVRRRVEDHAHLKRRSKRNGAQVFRWRDGEIGRVDNGRVINADRGTISIYKYRKEIWGLYKSSTIHNVKSERWPWFVWALPLVVVLVVVFAYLAKQRLSDVGGGLVGDVVAQSETGGTSETANAPGLLSVADDDGFVDPVRMEARRVSRGLVYLDERTPVISGVPDSAPQFAEAREVASVPRLQCVLYGHDKLPELAAGSEVDRFPVGGICRCYSQQATRVTVDDAVCVDIVRRGYFEPALPDTALAAASQGPPEALTPTADHVDEKRGQIRDVQEPRIIVVRDNSYTPQVDIQAALKRVDALRELSEGVEARP